MNLKGILQELSRLPVSQKTCGRAWFQAATSLAEGPVDVEMRKFVETTDVFDVRRAVSHGG